MKMGYAPVKDSEVSANGSNDHEINRRYDKHRKGVCPSMTTHKDQEIDRVVRKSVKDQMNSRMGVCPSAN